LAQPLSRNRDFTLLQVGQGLSTLGAETSAIAYPLLVLAITGSPAKAGAATFARAVPYVLFALFAGVVADRLNRKRLMIGADVVRALAIGSVAVAIVADALTFPHILAAAFVEGAGFTLFNITEIGALRSVVAPHQLPAAAAVEQARLSTVVLAGPPLGGFLFGLGRAVPFVFDAVSYLFSLLTVAAMRTPFQEERERGRSRVGAEVAEGFRWLWQRPFLRTCALLFAGSNFAWSALILIAIVAAREQGLSSTATGLLIAAYGGASLAGSFVAPRLQRVLSMRTIVVGELWLAVGVAAYLVEPNVWILLAGVLPAAIGNPTLNATVIGYRTAVTPDRLQGRVASVARLVAFVGSPLGPLAAGLALEVSSPRATVALLTAWFVAIALAATLSRSVRNAPSLRELSAPPSEAATPLR
jgi:predicted MFS family arabinose efflux permease